MTDDSRQGDRIAKVIARAGLASRRDAEVMVTELRVKVNGRTVSNVATNILPGDKVTVDGKPLPQADGARLWLYHKPLGLVTSARDEKGRETVFDALPPELGRVMSVGRLDLNSEGLLLLTNDGELKRQLELPSTGWLRRYRVRINGTPTEATLDILRNGMTVDGEDFAPMQVTLDRQKGANAWLTVGLREGRNREIRRAMDAVDLYVNRLIRISYGPFQLGTLPPGDVEEIKPRVLREQLGSTFDGELAETRKGTGPMAEDDDKTRPVGRKPRPGGPRKPTDARGDRPARGGDGKPRLAKDGERKPFEKRAERPARDGDRPARGGDGKPRFAKDGERKPFEKRGERPARDGDGKPRFAKDGDRKPRESRDDARPARAARPFDRKGPEDKPKETKAERTTRLRADSSISLRKGGQRGKGIVKPKKPASTKRMKKPEDGKGED
ncbi:pseudouridine synthase [Jannaschia pohangensis]|uniref:Pseudouridine synthase n=1 Tax=Jannaschia pohangensis TaxID=390807 RepID=A0A1I3UFC4_9RHOB|nr:pseudouridine synthase [Jannaschia pohangensis]SFJ80576.1 23S rRNA pseudouridine2605 synthase [Jannaschia pohangensis]